MEQQLLNELKQLYSDGFPEDSVAEREEFFSHIQDENAFYIREHGQIVSAGYYTSKPAFLFQKNTHIPFLSALSTRRELRGQGRLASLLRLMLTQLSDRGEAVCMLYPFRHTYYLRHGFCDVSFCTERTVQCAPSAISVSSQPIENLEHHARIEEQFAASFDNHFIYGKKQIADKIAVYTLGGAHVYAYKDSYCIVEKNRVRHYAALSASAIAQNPALNGLTYCDFNGEDKPFAQARIVNAQRAIENAVWMPSLCTDIVFGITDSLLQHNNVTLELRIHHGRATASKTTKPADHTLDIATLCKLLFCGDNQLVPKQRNYFGELW